MSHQISIPSPAWSQSALTIALSYVFTWSMML